MGLSHRGCAASNRNVLQGYCDDLGRGKRREGIGGTAPLNRFPLYPSFPPPSPAQLSPSLVPVLQRATPAASCCSPTQACRPPSAGVRQALPPQPCPLPAHDCQTSRADVCSIAQATRLWKFQASATHSFFFSKHPSTLPCPGTS